MELHTNSNAVSYRPCSLVVSQTELSKNFIINIHVCYVLDVHRMFAIEFSALK